MHKRFVRQLASSTALEDVISVAAKCPKFCFVAPSTLAPLSLGLPEPAVAQCSGPASNATCTLGGNRYPNGINVDTNNGLGDTPINPTLQPGVIVEIPAGFAGVNAVNLANTTGVTPGAADLTINADGVTINNTFNPGGNNQTGLRIQ